MKWDADRAMEALQVPSEDRSTYAAFNKSKKGMEAAAFS